MQRLISWVRRFVKELRRRRVLRVAAAYAGVGFIILQIGEILVEPFGLPGWTLRLVTFLLALGFPLAVGLAWVFDVTDEGIVWTEGDGSETALESARERRSGPSIGLGIALLLIVVGALLYPQWGPTSTSSSAEGSPSASEERMDRSIAVLPFAALGEETPGAFARGMHEDLLTRLSKVSDLQVISRTSVERYRDTDLALPTIADSLGVRWVMEGSVQEAQDQIQVNAQLIDPRDDVHTWAETYRRKLTAENLFGIQEEITHEIANALRTTLQARERERIEEAPTEHLEAYRLYVQGRQHLNRRTEEGMRQSIEYFRQALDRDSSYAIAWSGLADALLQLRDYGYVEGDGIPSEAKTAVRRALELDPELAEAHASLALLHEIRQDGPAAVEELQRAIELRPGYGDAYNWLSWLHLLLGNTTEALDVAERGVRINPLSPEAVGNLAMAHLATGEPETALEEARRVHEIEPSYEGGPFFEGLFLYQLGRYGEAADRLRGLSVPWAAPGPRVSQALAQIEAGRPDSARLVLDRLDTTEHPFAVGLLHTALGEEEEALEAFDRMEEWGMWPTHAVRHLYQDIWSPLQDDPRYKALVRDMNQAWGLTPEGEMPPLEERSTGLEAGDWQVSL